MDLKWRPPRGLLFLSWNCVFTAKPPQPCNRGVGLNSKIQANGTLKMPWSQPAPKDQMSSGGRSPAWSRRERLSRMGKLLCSPQQVQVRRAPSDPLSQGAGQSLVFRSWLLRQPFNIAKQFDKLEISFADGCGSRFSGQKLAGRASTSPYHLAWTPLPSFSQLKTSIHRGFTSALFRQLAFA